MRFTDGIFIGLDTLSKQDSRYSPTQMTFARLHTVKVRLDTKTFAQVARCRAQSHSARMFSVLLVAEENHVGTGVETL